MPPPKMTEAIDLSAMPSTANTVLAWRIRPKAAVRTWPLTPAGSLAAALLLPASAAGWYAGYTIDDFRISWVLAGLLIGVAWILNVLIAHAVRKVRQSAMKALSPTRRYHWATDGLFGLTLLVILWFRLSGGTDLRLAGIVCSAICCSLLSVVSSFRLIRTAAERRPAGFGQTLAEEFGGSWHRLIERFQTAGSPEELRHSFFGMIDGTSQPLLLDDRLANSHIVVFGATRSGKSTRAFLPLLIQKVRHNHRARGERTQRRDKSTILYFDLKGSWPEFGSLAMECRRLRVNFRWFTTESPRSSYVFNVLNQPAWQALSINEKAQLLMSSLALDFGEATSGDAYYGGLAERVLAGALTICPDVRSLRELYEVIIAPDFRDRINMSKHDFDNAGALVSQLRRLADIQPLNWVPGDAGGDQAAAGAILIEQLLTEPGVVYFRLPATVEPLSARTIPRLLIRLLMAAARRQGAAKVQVYIVIDEAQETLQRSLAPVLKQARDLRISLWMAMQNLSDLEGAGAGLGDVVLGNTSVRIFFSAGDLSTRQYLAAVGGEQRRLVYAKGEGTVETPQGVNFVQNHGENELIVPLLGIPECNQLNAQEGLCVVEASPKSGFTALNHPVFVRTCYFCSPAQYKRFTEIMWPAANAFTVVNEGGSSVRRPEADSDEGAAGSAVNPMVPQTPNGPQSATAEIVSPLPEPRPKRRGKRKPAAAEEEEHQQIALQLLRLSEQSSVPQDASQSR